MIAATDKQLVPSVTIYLKQLVKHNQSGVAAAKFLLIC